MKRRTLALTVLEGEYAVIQIPASNSIPAWIQNASIWSVTKTLEEYSIVCPARAVVHPDHLKVEADWRCLKVHGPFDFDEVGIISGLTSILAEHEIGVFVISTYETDYLLVKNTNLKKALKALSEKGHRIIRDQSGD